MKKEPPQRRSSPRAELQVRNFQRRHAVDRRGLSSFFGRIASAVGWEQSSATLALVTDDRIRSLNRRFRGLDQPTDVLSFAMDGDGSYLGDIVISVETAHRQARRLGNTLPRELRLLTLHGFLHLLGYDHATDKGEMRRIEYRLRKKFRITRRRAERAPRRRARKR